MMPILVLGSLDLVVILEGLVLVLVLVDLGRLLRYLQCLMSILVSVVNMI